MLVIWSKKKGKWDIKHISIIRNVFMSVVQTEEYRKTYGLYFTMPVLKTISVLHFRSLKNNKNEDY